MALPRINVVGAGKLASTLVRLFTDSGMLQAGDFYNRSPAHTEAAIKFCGSGRVAHSLNTMTNADIWLIGTPDDAITQTASKLAQAKDHWHGTVVFHASGLHSSALLAPLRAKGAFVASAHPAHSFARPQQSLGSYAGSTCTLEGDDQAIARLGPLFEKIDSTVIAIPRQGKALYHVATVLAANYLVALQRASLDLLERAGLESAAATSLIQALMSNALSNTETLGATGALTGPVTRGDLDTLNAHLKALAADSPETLALYRELGKVAINIARDQARLSETTLGTMEDLFGER